MPRIAPVETETVGPELRDIFELFLRQRGNVPNMFRTLAHVPPLLTSFIAHFRAVMEPGGLPVALKELVATHVSQLNGCEY